MTTNADLIAEARRIFGGSCVCGGGESCQYHREIAEATKVRDLALADALEASEAQVARLRATLTSVQHYFGPAPQSWPECAEESYASEIAKALYGDPYPADLLEAVDRLTDSNCDCTLTAEEAREPQRQHDEAIAVITRYGLLSAAPRWRTRERS